MTFIAINTYLKMSDILADKLWGVAEVVWMDGLDGWTGWTRGNFQYRDFLLFSVIDINNIFIVQSAGRSLTLF